MKFNFSPQHSKIVDFLTVPAFIFLDKSHFDLSNEEAKQFKDALADFEAIQAMLKPYEERIRKYFLLVEMNSFMEYFFFDCLNQGREFESFEEFLEHLQEMSQKSPIENLQDLFVRWIIDEEKGEIQDPEEALVASLDQKDWEDEIKWSIYWGFRNIKTMLGEMIPLYREIIPLYLPFYQKYEADIQECIQTVDFSKIYEGTPVDVVGLVEQATDKEAQVFVWPTYRFMHKFQFHYWPGRTNLYIFYYPKADIFFKIRQRVTDEILDICLKALSDPIRYQILKEIERGDLKNKEIADSLNITPANVSFHIQKLINAKLIKVSQLDGPTKYQVYKPTLLEIIQVLEEDFDLKDEK